MDREEAKTILRRLANQNCIGYGTHCREQMAARKVKAQDFFQVLNWGEVISVNPAKHGGLKCKVTGADTDGDDLTLVVILDEEHLHVTCVTVF